MNFKLLGNTILLTIGGSRAYGIHKETSDVDVKGVALPPLEYYLGFLRTFEQADSPENIKEFTRFLNDEEKRISQDIKLEGVVYDLKKFMKLASQANPNILDVLFCRDEEVRLIGGLGRKLRENRDLFISAKAKHTFSGYAFSQLNRIKGHYEWHTNGPKRAPTRADYDLPELTLIPQDQLKAANAAIQKQIDEWNFDFEVLSDADRIHVTSQVEKYLIDLKIGLDERWTAAARIVGLNENFIELMQRERRYNSAMNNWKRYLTWKKNRNPARAKLEADYGYDTKHAAHLVRLLRMGKEILSTGRVNVWRGDIDAEELVGIRNGAWTYEQLLEYASSEIEELDFIYKNKNYSIPHTPDYEKIDNLCFNMVYETI